jgi:UDP-N-acetylmuramoyl-L-alanyl-D-glutamate--2,6-diaminopimelate ligase
MTIKGKIKQFIPPFLLNIYHFKLALLGAFLYGFPGYNKSIKIIGVTGTSGKSTTVNLICNILEEAGFSVASFSTVRFKIGKQEWKNELKMTMPGRMKVQKFLRQAINQKCQFAVLEVSSEGIKQSRHKFINFDTAVFTNLTPEHIESHGGFENYRNEKLKLFKATKNIHIINADDKNAEYFLNIPAKQKIKFSISDNLKYKLNLKLVGEFNLMNALSALAIAKAYNISEVVCKKALESATGIPGRMEKVSESPDVIIDYAHTPEQLESVYKSLGNKPLVCVLGSCGGGRDKWKRPVLGEIAKKYCKEIIITNEDPYDENPMDIINQISEKAGDSAKKILDRREAIKKAIELAKPNDTVIITGKGSEPWMCVANGKKIPWDDREIVRGILRENELDK